MAEIRVRNLPDWLVEWYKDSAEQQGKSLVLTDFVEKLAHIA
jgi:hypothetical protein